jgi:hypothetical protein
MPVWNDQCQQQGFARSDDIIYVATLIRSGGAIVRIWRSGDWRQMGRQYARVHQFPYVIRADRVQVGSPPAYPLQLECSMPSGHYRLVVAQLVTTIDPEMEETDVDIVLQPAKLLASASEILVKDADLHPTYPLLERSVDDIGLH